MFLRLLIFFVFLCFIRFTFCFHYGLSAAYKQRAANSGANQNDST